VFETLDAFTVDEKRKVECIKGAKGENVEGSSSWFRSLNLACAALKDAQIALAYTIDSRWRNRAEFINGRNEIIAFLARKWARELDYRLIKELWAFTANRIAVRFAYEWHDDSGHWYRSFGNENWEFGGEGLMAFRYASINDLPILESDRKYHWPLGPVLTATQG
jgi:nuclear transport factor 2 (NTF2) superfamily protein